jgi:uncharacterized pyridoxal phosphate-containing UPF0001 family protein
MGTKIWLPIIFCELPIEWLPIGTLNFTKFRRLVSFFAITISVKEMEVNSSIQRRRVKEISADHDWKLWETGKIQYPVIKRG